MQPTLRACNDVRMIALAGIVPDPGTLPHFFAPLARARKELAVFAYRNRRGMLIGLRHCHGGLDETILPLRSVVRDALALNAASIMIAHNHPSGMSQPSKADCETTRLIARTLRPIGLWLADHWVVGREDSSSFLALGLL
ncbi:JAB domain-containing protein [Stakelama pacifica]|uniref:RadC-like JAB domain-containing protein n=1 Tax=Stakelama pacifica TaxID=517720 RepID=A0A4V3BT05_9SPHN|nr:JAB domain-containing protein [Stakelama pacifica]TDN80768.1 RadC-like JAB domain-containing protein [Stakelama pacifica]